MHVIHGQPPSGYHASSYPRLYHETPLFRYGHIAEYKGEAGAVVNHYHIRQRISATSPWASPVVASAHLEAMPLLRRRVAI
jgi:hypothetical protein